MNKKFRARLLIGLTFSMCAGCFVYPAMVFAGSSCLTLKSKDCKSGLVGCGCDNGVANPCVGKFGDTSFETMQKAKGTDGTKVTPDHSHQETCYESDHPCSDAHATCEGGGESCEPDPNQHGDMHTSDKNVLSGDCDS